MARFRREIEAIVPLRYRFVTSVGSTEDLWPCENMPPSPQALQNFKKAVEAGEPMVVPVDPAMPHAGRPDHTGCSHVTMQGRNYQSVDLVEVED